MSNLRETEAKDAEILELRKQRIEYDCRFTLGNVADISGIHCPVDRPCMRCQVERRDAEIARLSDNVRKLVADGNLAVQLVGEGYQIEIARLKNENIAVSTHCAEILEREARLRAALEEAIVFIESDACGGNVLAQRLSKVLEEGK